MYTFTKLHDRRIPKVRVGVGPMEFKLIQRSDGQYFCHRVAPVVAVPRAENVQVEPAILRNRSRCAGKLVRLGRRAAAAAAAAAVAVRPSVRRFSFRAAARRRTARVVAV